MHFLSEVIKEFCLCPNCGAELIINEMESVNINDESLLNITLDSECADCGNKWNHSFDIDFMEKD